MPGQYLTDLTVGSGAVVENPEERGRVEGKGRGREGKGTVGGWLRWVGG